MADVSVPLMTRRTRRIVIAGNLVYPASLLLLGVAPDLPDVAADFPDFAAHGIAYAAHAALMFVLLLPLLGRSKAAIMAFAGAVIFGGFVETLQFLQPARSVEVRDLFANTVGAGVAATFLYYVTGSRTVDGHR